MKFQTLTRAAFALALSACESSSEKLTYELSHNGCDTGKHEFSSKDEYCAGLKNYRLNNNGCAHALRKETFEKGQCSGEFQEENR